MIKKILGVIIGYTIFVVTSLALFKFSGQNPHGQATTSFQILTVNLWYSFFIFKRTCFTTHCQNQ